MIVGGGRTGDVYVVWKLTKEGGSRDTAIYWLIDWFSTPCFVFCLILSARINRRWGGIKYVRTRGIPGQRMIGDVDRRNWLEPACLATLLGCSKEGSACIFRFPLLAVGNATLVRRVSYYDLLFARELVRHVKRSQPWNLKKESTGHYYWERMLALTIIANLRTTFNVQDDMICAWISWRWHPHQHWISQSW